MNTKSNLYKTIRVALIVLALTFGNSMHAVTPVFFNWFGKKIHKHHHGCGHGGNQGGNDAVPLDGGLGILLVGAAAFGVKKLRENKNEEV